MRIKNQDCLKRCLLLEFDLEWKQRQDVASTLDRINLSDRKFVILAAAIAKANDKDLSTGPLSHSMGNCFRCTPRIYVD